MDENAQRWAALTLATRDYVCKSGFSDVCVGLSGGVDSSLTAAIATDALGADRVHGVLMPSRHSSEHSVTDAEKLAANLGIDALIVGIEPAHAALAEMIEAGLGRGLDTGGITDQNLQSRIRGVTLMALANEHGWLVLTTGNKSELAVGYSTLYGDTAGAFAVISDLWKLGVYELCRWRNEQAGGRAHPLHGAGQGAVGGVGPRPARRSVAAVLRGARPHPASLRRGPADRGRDPGVPDRAGRGRGAGVPDGGRGRVQAPPVADRPPRLTGRAFRRDRRMPIVNRYRSASGIRK